MEKAKKAVNDIRIRFSSRIGRVVSYCERLLKEDNMREISFSAVGGSIGILVNVVEILKTITPGLYQINRIATVSYQSVEEGGKAEIQNQRLYPKLEVKLTLDKPEIITEGFQDVLDEAKRKELLELHLKRRAERRRRFRGRRGVRGRRGGFRGRRSIRGRRGGFRGRSPFGKRRGPIRNRTGRPMKNGRGRPPVNAKEKAVKEKANPN
jgi:F0F1-type ATP synthase epsilon subunit